MSFSTSPQANRLIGIPDVPLTCYLTRAIPDPRKKKYGDLVDDEGNAGNDIPMSKWACNQELYSNYLMKKAELAAQYKTYLMDHPALRALMSDFMQKLLFKQPTDIFDFANQFFIPLLRITEEDSESEGCETDSSGVGNESSEENEEEDEAFDEEIMKNVIQLHQALFPIEDGGEGDEDCDCNDVDSCVTSEVNPKL